MEFKIIYGKSGTGKTTYIFNQIKEKIKQKNKIYIIVPEQMSFVAEQHLLNTIDTNSSINAEVLTLSRMADRVISETIGNLQTHLSKIGKSMIIYDALDNQKDKMNFLKSSDKNLELVQRTITEFKKHNVDKENLSKAINNLEDKYLQLKLSDIKNVLDKYQEKIQGSYIDEADSLTILAENIELVDFFTDSIIYIDEFAGFTPIEYKIIEKLCTLAKEITITVCTDSLENVENLDDSIYYFNQITAEKLLDIAKKTGSYIEKINIDEIKKFKSQELLSLAENLYTNNTKKYTEKTQDIQLFIAQNPHYEVENVAQNILDLVKNKNYRYKDIAVVSADIENYSEDIKAIFEEYNIPVFIDEKKDVSQNILMKYIISLLNIYANNYSYESMFSYIKSGILEIPANKIFLLENYVKKWGIRGSKWYKSDFEFEEKNDIQDEVNKTKKQIIEPIIELKKNLSGEKTAKEITKKLYEFIEKNNIQENILKKAEELEEKEQKEAADGYRAGIKIFFDVLDEIFMIFENDKMSFERYNKILQIGISQSEFGRIPSSFDQVLFGDTDRTKTRDIKILFLLGINDGAIPNILKDEGFLNDKDRDRLKENNIEIAKNSLELLYENQFNIYKVLCMPEEKLYLSYPVTDKEGKAIRPSILITQIKKIFENLTEDSDIIEKKYKITTKQATLNNVIEKYKQYLDGENIDEEWENAILWYKQNQKDKITKILKGADYTNIPEQITAGNIKEIYGKNLRTSISRLEQYRKCPFSFHLKYGLKLNEEEEFKIRSLDTGNFMHEVIDEVFSKIETNQLDVKTISKEELNTIIEEIINQKLGMSKNYIFTSSPKFIVLTKRLKKVVNESIQYIIEQLKNSKFELYGHELEFNEKSELKPMKIDLENGNQVTVTGKIDRIDIAKTENNTYVRIIDYKSSVKDINLNQVVAGIQIQLLTYLHEISQQKQFDPAGVLYFSLIDTIIKADKKMTDEQLKKEINKNFKMKGMIVADIDIVKMMDKKLAPSTSSDIIPVYLDKEGNISEGKSKTLNKEKFERLQKYTKHIISEISKEIFSGNIDIKPYYMSKKTPCEYCQYKTICNFDPKLENNTYRYIKNLSNEEILSDICKNNK